MQPSDNCLDLIKQFEGYANQAYEDTGGVWTIGYGTTRYPSGYKVQEGDRCTLDEAETYLRFDIAGSVNLINKLPWEQPLRQNQFDALVSFQYNTGHLIGSTLYKKAKMDPNDETIYKYKIDQSGNVVVDSCEFVRWVRDNGRIITGLINRRKKEADLYSL